MTLAQTVIDQEIAQFGWVDSIATNSINDFKSPKSNIAAQATDRKESDLIDKFLCHMIFYVIFCYSLFLYVVIDLGYGSFLQNKLTTLMRRHKKSEIASCITTHSH